MNRVKVDLDRNGFAILPDLLNSNEVLTLLEGIASADDYVGARRRSSVYPIRNPFGLGSGFLKNKIASD